MHGQLDYILIQISRGRLGRSKSRCSSDTTKQHREDDFVPSRQDYESRDWHCQNRYSSRQPSLNLEPNQSSLQADWQPVSTTSLPPFACEPFVSCTSRFCGKLANVAISTSAAQEQDRPTWDIRSVICWIAELPRQHARGPGHPEVPNKPRIFWKAGHFPLIQHPQVALEIDMSCPGRRHNPSFHAADLILGLWHNRQEQLAELGWGSLLRARLASTDPKSAFCWSRFLSVCVHGSLETWRTKYLDSRWLSQPSFPAPIARTLDVPFYKDKYDGRGPQPSFKQSLFGLPKVYACAFPDCLSRYDSVGQNVDHNLTFRSSGVLLAPCIYSLIFFVDQPIREFVRQIRYCH